jgi:hypothetical protein
MASQKQKQKKKMLSLLPLQEQKRFILTRGGVLPPPMHPAVPPQPLNSTPSLSWSQKYSPKAVADLVVHKKKV